MKRYFYLSNDLDDLQKVQTELEGQGVTTPQIHVLSESDGEVEKRHLHEVEAILKKDIIHSTKIGAVVGVIGALLVLGAAYLFNWTATPVGWIPFIFLAIVVLGFCTWEGGFYGIQAPHYQFKRFQKALRQGKHILMVDVDQEQQAAVEAVIQQHPKLKGVGADEGAPRWWVRWQNNWSAFIKSMP